MTTRFLVPAAGSIKYQISVVTVAKFEIEFDFLRVKATPFQVIELIAGRFFEPIVTINMRLFPLPVIVWLIVLDVPDMAKSEVTASKLIPGIFCMDEELEHDEQEDDRQLDDDDDELRDEDDDDRQLLELELEQLDDDDDRQDDEEQLEDDDFDEEDDDDRDDELLDRDDELLDRDDDDELEAAPPVA